MALEAIKNAGMAYQGSVPAAEIKAETSSGMEEISNKTAAARPAQETVAVNTNRSNEDGLGQGSVEDSEALERQRANQNAKINNAVGKINKKMHNSEAVFGIHDKTNRVTIKIVDKDTKEVIKEYPPEKTLDMIAKVWEMAGIMVDEKR